MNKLVAWPVTSCLALAASLSCARVDPKERSSEDGGRGVPNPNVAGTGGRAGLGSGGTDRGAGPATGGAAGRSAVFEADAGMGDGSVCGLVHSSLEREPPDVLIVLDRSKSMSDQVIPPGFDVGMFVLCLLLKNCPPTTSKWEAMTGALETSVTGGAAAVNYGLKLFPEDDNCGVADGVAVPIAADNGKAINDKLAGAMPGGATPTTTAIASAGRYLSNLGRPNPRFVLLATDGEPTCGGDGAAATAAVANLAAAGIPVYVIGIATEGMADTTLSAMAMAGGRPRSASPPYYPVQTAAEAVASVKRFIDASRHNSHRCVCIVHGRGLFHIHPQTGPVFSIEVTKGDMIRVPRGTHHWFDLCTDKTIRAVRLFQDMSGWTPHYTESGVDAGYEPLCFGVSYIPHAE